MHKFTSSIDELVDAAIEAGLYRPEYGQSPEIVDTFEVDVWKSCDKSEKRIGIYDGPLISVKIPELVFDDNISGNVAKKTYVLILINGTLFAVRIDAYGKWFITLGNNFEYLTERDIVRQKINDLHVELAKLQEQYKNA